MTPAQTRLTRTIAIAAALRIVDRDGLDGLTMRRLGLELQTDPMAVYYHLPNKSAILDGVVEAVLAEIPLDGPELASDDDMEWRDQVTRLARAYRAALIAHPNAIILVASRPDVSPTALRLIDRAIGILLRTGMPAATAVEAMAAVSAYIVGNALAETGSSLGAGDGWSIEEAARDIEATARSGDFPHLAAILEDATPVDSDHAFETGLALMLDGLERRLPRGSEPRGRTA